ncbi:MAG: glycosyltransferase family 4 protein [Casimicrobiaceae bacterium]
MRIAVWHNLASGGAKRALYAQVKGLTRRGHSVVAWCPSSADTGFLPLSSIVEERVVPFAWKDASSTGRFDNLMYPLRSMQLQLAAMARNCEICAAQIAAEGFDLLFASPCLFFRAPPIGAMLGRMPRVLYLQEPFRRLYEALPVLPWLGSPLPAAQSFRGAGIRRALRDWIRMQGLRLQANTERANAENFDKILVNSLYSRESVLRAYGLDAELCYLGISSDVFRPTGVQRERFVIGVGSITFEKGIDIAIRAIAAIPEATRPPLTWIANLVSQPYCDEMQSLASSLRVAFTIRTRLPDGEVVALLNKAAVMLYTSRLEPFGLAPLEANACGTPVVAVAEGGIRETIRHMHNGLLVQSRDAAALGRATLLLLDDPGLAQRLGTRGRHDVDEQWGWDAAVDRLEAHLQAVAGASHGS